MSSPVTIALPVSLEQIAAAINHLNQAEQLHLLELVPNLRRLASQISTRRAVDDLPPNAESLRERIRAAGHPHLFHLMTNCSRKS
jgi:hypothetical protein